MATSSSHDINNPLAAQLSTAESVGGRLARKCLQILHAGSVAIGKLSVPAPASQATTASDFIAGE
jgi:C4-dicarboxylate-specific signal transduction histidine kinase